VPRSAVVSPPIGQAPGDLATVQAFVNTLDIEQSTDELDTGTALTRWLAAAGLLDDPQTQVEAADLRAALDLREALRSVLRSHARHGQADAAAPRLQRIAAGLTTRLAAGPDGQIKSVPAGSGVEAALTRILLIAAESATLGTWTRLKACSADDCQWAFYDRSPTRNGCWCSMQICGSRAKSRAYRQRASAAGSGPGPAKAVTASRSARSAAPGA
jgi:predicted RNA-binding Zn ribbon-like protein